MPSFVYQVLSLKTIVMISLVAQANGLDLTASSSSNKMLAQSLSSIPVANAGKKDRKCLLSSSASGVTPMCRAQI